MPFAVVGVPGRPIYIGSRRAQLDFQEWNSVENLSRSSFNRQIC